MALKYSVEEDYMILPINLHSDTFQNMSAGLISLRHCFSYISFENNILKIEIDM